MKNEKYLLCAFALIILLIGYAITKQNILDLHIEFGILNGFKFNCKFVN